MEPGLTVLNGLMMNGLSLVPIPLANFGFDVVLSGSASSYTAITLSRSKNSGTSSRRSSKKHSGKHHHANPPSSSLSPSPCRRSQISPLVFSGLELMSSGSEPQSSSSWS